MLDKVVEDSECHVRADGTCTIAKQQGHMHRLAYLTALHDQRRLHPLAHADEVMMHGAHGQQRWDGCMLVIDVTVSEDDVVHTFIHACLSGMAEVVESRSQPFLASLHIKEHRQFLGLESLIPYVA